MEDRLCDVPKVKKPLLFKKPTEKIWTERKAEIVANYLSQFQIITKHGICIDGFAGMHDKPNNWAARLVLGIDPPRLGPFHLIDKDAAKVRGLRELAKEYPDREINVIPGD